MLAADVHQPGDQARNAAGVVRASNAHDGNTSVLFGREQMRHDGRAHRLAFTVGRFDVREQAGAGIDLDHAGALAAQRQGAVLQHHVHSGNVQTHHARGQSCCGGYRGVHQRGDVQRHIAVALNEHTLVFGGHRLGVQPHALQLQNDFFAFAGGHHIERKILAPAPPRVAVDLQLG